MIFLVQIATNLFQMIIAQISLAIATNQSIVSLGGVNTIQSVLFSFGGILGAFSFSLNIKSAKAIGENNYARYQTLLKSSIIINILLGLFFLILILLGGRFFLQTIFGFQGNILKISSRFLLIMSPYLLLTLLMFLLTNILKIEHKTHCIFLISVGTSIIDLILNYVLVKGIWIFPKMGVYGAAIASIVSLFILVSCHFLLVKKVIISAFKSSQTAIKELVFFGIPLATQEILEGVIFVIVFEALISRLGVQKLAIYAICSQALNLIQLPTYMYGNAITVFISEANGEKNLEKAIQSFKIGIGSSFLLSIFLSLLILTNLATFTSLFSDNRMIQKSIFSYVLVAILSMILFPLYELTKISLQSLHKENFVLLSTIAVNLVIIFLMLIGRVLDIFSFFGLYMLYGVNILVLGILFFMAMFSDIFEENLLITHRPVLQCEFKVITS